MTTYLSSQPNKWFFQTHEAGLVDLYAQVRNDGTVTWTPGCPFTVTVPATNVLLFTLKQTIPISSSDLTDTTRSYLAFGTGVTKTFAIDAMPVVSWANGPTSVNLKSTLDVVTSTPTISGDYLQFYVQFYGTLLNSLGQVGSYTDNVITLVTAANAANFTAGQYITGYATNAYGVPSFTMEVASSSTGAGTVTLVDDVPSDITDFYLFNAATLYANVTAQVTTEIVIK